MSQEQTILRIENIYNSVGSKTIHEGVSFTVYPGEILTLMGASGTGKSFLLRTLIGLHRPDKGRIYFHDQEISQLKEKKWKEIRKKIAYVFQHGALFDSLTVYENLSYPLIENTDLSQGQIKEKVYAALSMIGLVGVEDMYPEQLSGGMQKRVGVARSIILDPEVILYDEPTTGLDPFNTNQIMQIIKKLQSRGKTSILVTHDMHSLFTVSDRVAYLKNGVIHRVGTNDEFRSSNDPDIRGFVTGAYQSES